MPATPEQYDLDMDHSHYSRPHRCTRFRLQSRLSAITARPN